MIDEIRENVHILLTKRDTQLEACYHFHAQTLSPFDTFIESTDVVMVGDGENFESYAMSPLYQIIGY